MEITSLTDTDPMLAHLPSDAVILTIEGARESLTLASKLLIDLQVMNDEAHDLCEELEVLLETLNQITNMSQRLQNIWLNLSLNGSKQRKIWNPQVQE